VNLNKAAHGSRQASEAPAVGFGDTIWNSVAPATYRREFMLGRAAEEEAAVA
jgi:hypothetical protein